MRLPRDRHCNQRIRRCAVREALQAIAADNDALVLNIADAAQTDEALKGFIAEFGTPGVVVNNAGITRDNLFLRMSDDEWEQVINTNLSGVFRVCKAMVKPMIKKKTGAIINVSSIIGTTGNAGQANYAAAKAGLEGFSRSLAQEIASRNITVNCVAPGFIQTDMTEILPETQKEAILATFRSSASDRLKKSQELLPFWPVLMLSTLQARPFM